MRADNLENVPYHNEACKMCGKAAESHCDGCAGPGVTIERGIHDSGCTNPRHEFVRCDPPVFAYLMPEWYS